MTYPGKIQMNSGANHQNHIRDHRNCIGRRTRDGNHRRAASTHDSRIGGRRAGCVKPRKRHARATTSQRACTFNRHRYRRKVIGHNIKRRPGGHNQCTVLLRRCYGGREQLGSSLVENELRRADQCLDGIHIQVHTECQCAGAGLGIGLAGCHRADSQSASARDRRNPTGSVVNNFGEGVVAKAEIDGAALSNDGKGARYCKIPNRGEGHASLGCEGDVGVGSRHVLVHRAIKHRSKVLESRSTRCEI